MFGLCLESSTLWGLSLCCGKIGIDAGCSSALCFHVLRDGCRYCLDCHIFDGLSVKSFVLSVVPASHGWEQHLLRNAMSVLSCVTSRLGLTFVCVSDNIGLGRALAKVANLVVPLVRKRFDLNWMKDLNARQFLKELLGLEPFRSPGRLQIQVDSCDLGQWILIRCRCYEMYVSVDVLIRESKTCMYQSLSGC